MKVFPPLFNYDSTVLAKTYYTYYNPNLSLPFEHELHINVQQNYLLVLFDAPTKCLNVLNWLNYGTVKSVGWSQK